MLRITPIAALVLAVACRETVPVPSAFPEAVATPSSAAYNIYFGDLQLHTTLEHDVTGFEKEFSQAVVEVANLYARDVLHHDFIAVTSHSRLLQDWMWEVHKEVADEFTEDGVFVSFPAYEWSSSRPMGGDCDPPLSDLPNCGDRCVYFRNTEAASLFRYGDLNYDTPTELFRALPGPDDALTIPHHTAKEGRSFVWATFNSDYDRSVELVQHTGSHEADLIENGWSDGHVFGVVAGSDNHHAIAGRGGIAAILAPTLTRDALFDALINRHTYATSHGDILVHFFGDQEMQGAVLSKRSSIRLHGQIESRSGDIKLVELLDNGVVIKSWHPIMTTALEFDSVRQTGDEPHYFYLRVTLVNNHKAWSSPIWVNYLSPSTPLWRSLDELVAFLGYGVEPTGLTPGRPFEIATWWKALAEMDRDYSVFVHLVDPENRILAQGDKLLQDGHYPTSIWQPGRIVRETHRLEVPPDMPAGEYTVKVGIYFWETGERLPVWDEDGERVAGDAILLETITVTE